MTLRSRLTIFYTVLLGITIIVFSAIIYVVLESSLVNEVDRVLLSTSREVEQKIAGNVVGMVWREGVPTLLIDPSPTSEFTTPGIYIQVLDKQGQVIARSANLSSESLPINPDLAQAALQGQSNVTNTSPGQPAEPLRIFTTPMRVADTIVGVLQVGASLYNVRLTMRRLISLLSTGVLATMLVGAAGIWLMTRRALRPLYTIARTAESIGSSQDLSQRLQIRNPNDEVGRLARAFNAMIGRLEGVFASQKQFIADSSHELRTPLTVIRGNLDLIKRDTRPESITESLEAIDQESTRMGAIVDDLLMLAQLDGVQSPLCSPVALDEVTLQVYNQARVLANDRQISLGRVDAVTIMADHSRLVQMLLNLVDNAIKYTQPGGLITIECAGPAASRHPGFAILSVKDTGIGIAAEDIPHIFDRFYRVDKARSRRAGGTGLGLTIAKGIAESYGGRIDVQSTPGQGSTFSVLFPATA